MNQTQIEQLKYIWSYMVICGKLTDGTFSQYSGRFGYPSVKIVETKEIIEAINKHGIAWDATGIPEFRTYSEFVGTDCPNDSVDTLMGDLVLKNGQMFRLGVKEPETSYVDAVEQFHTEWTKPDYLNEVFGSYTHD